MNKKMTERVEFGCLATGIGSMPQTTPEEASSLVMKYLPVIPHWTQLPKRSPLENMYIQFSEGFPGAVVEGDRIYVEKRQNFDYDLGQLYADYKEDNPDNYAISAEYAAGLHHFMFEKAPGAKMVKGQVTGPVSWGLTVTDREHRGIVYDEVLGDIVAKFLKLKALWQERTLRRIYADTIIFVDEPYLASLGSAFVSVSNERVVTLLEEVFAGISGLKGIHCCGGADWSLLLRTTINILSFDAYNYAESLSLYPGEVKSFLERGGTIAWGIVPNDEEALAKESIPSLRDRLGEAMAPFTRNGIRFRQLVKQGLLTPSCGLAYLSPEASVQALELLSGLSDHLRKRYIT